LIVTSRKRNEISEKLKALTAQFNFEALVASFFPLLAFAVCYLIAPKLMLPMVITPVGWATMGVIVVLELIGLQILKKICNIKL
jgi:tight adherence protein B